MPVDSEGTASCPPLELASSYLIVSWTDGQLAYSATEQAVLTSMFKSSPPALASCISRLSSCEAILEILREPGVLSGVKRGEEEDHAEKSRSLKENLTGEGKPQATQPRFHRWRGVIENVA